MILQEKYIQINMCKCLGTRRPKPSSTTKGSARPKPKPKIK